MRCDRENAFWYTASRGTFGEKWDRATSSCPSNRSACYCSRIDGDFRRFPIGKHKVGSVAATNEAVCVEDARRDSRWLVRPDWARREGILGFGGQPLAYHGETLGVLGVFTRSCMGREALNSLRILADHAAAAIATARAFEENARLRQQLELENQYLREEISLTQAFGEILGTSPAIRHIEERGG